MAATVVALVTAGVVSAAAGSAISVTSLVLSRFAHPLVQPRYGSASHTRIPVHSTLAPRKRLCSAGLSMQHNPRTRIAREACGPPAVRLGGMPVVLQHPADDVLPTRFVPRVAPASKVYSTPL